MEIFWCVCVPSFLIHSSTRYIIIFLYPMYLLWSCFLFSFISSEKIWWKISTAVKVEKWGRKQNEKDFWALENLMNSSRVTRLMINLSCTKIFKFSYLIRERKFLKKKKQIRSLIFPLKADVFSKRKLAALHTRHFATKICFMNTSSCREMKDILKYMFLEQFIIKNAERLAFEKGAGA